MFQRVLIANRGAIACRIQRTLRKLGVTSIAVASDADEESPHRLQADESIRLRGDAATDTYLNIDKIIAAAKESGAEAIHPGYGFLSENPEFARRCEEAGIAFIGPTPEQLRTCGLKHVCREIAKERGVPLLEGSALLETAEDALKTAEAVGFPVILKSSAGGGGIGMQIAREPREVEDLFNQVRRLSASNFGDSSLFLEKYIERARHIEVQVFGDGKGNVISLGERDCSVQRRNQKVIEETPAPGLADEDRAELAGAAVRIATSVNYRSAGTVEFLWDEIDRKFFFLEVNARLQVEHGVTEEVWGLDLVEWMIRLAAGELPPLSELASNLQPGGHAIQARLYAEDPHKDFLPGSGLITLFNAPEDLRCDSGIETGTEVSSFYDPMLAKVISLQPTREEAIAALIHGLEELDCHGIETNQAYVANILKSEAFAEAAITTRFLNRFDYAPQTIDVLDPGLETTVQDYPGRIGRWDVGVPPSGPFDALSFRLGNQILGNDESAAGLELAVRGPKLRFNRETTICLTGADMGAKLDGNPIEQFQPIRISAGQTLKLGSVIGPGQRAYLLVNGGIQVPEYLGSRSTFRLGKFGGHGGRALKAGDVLPMAEWVDQPTNALIPEFAPQLTDAWNLRVTYGPHGAPEFFTDEDIETFFAIDWEVHYNSDRTGVRLIGPKPKWARRDGGEAGLHPSNIHDNAYCVGSIDFTGDMPILLGPDGPSLGGFVCPAVIAREDLWKMGQLRPGDTVRFHPISNDRAETDLVLQETDIREFTQNPDRPIQVSSTELDSPILKERASIDATPGICFRQSGDGVILIEFGEKILDLDLRFRVQALYEAIQSEPFPGLLELVPGIRSLQVQFDPLLIPRNAVVDLMLELEENLPQNDDLEFPSRIVHLPLSWDDPATQEAIQKYMQIVRDDAPWCPSNIEFIRRINGLASQEDVRRIVYEASYFVLGLGDVYLGAPVATPLDPRHRLVTTKYNPARTWTPENAVGIGGAYLCIYGMEGPGGYQFVGRTLPIWNRFRTTDRFEPGKPWLLRFFDQIRWFPVEAEELLEMRKEFLTGRYDIKIEETTFRPADYHEFLREHETSIADFRQAQRQAFDEERQRWEESGAMTFEAEEPELPPSSEEVEVPEGCEAVTSPVAGSLWKRLVEAGDSVQEDQALFIVESMKMEISVGASENGRVRELLIEEGATVRAGQILAIFEIEDLS